jgi:hypothetical protein
MHPLKRKTTIYEEKRGICILKDQKMSRCKKNKTSYLISLKLGNMKDTTVRETTQKRIAFCVNHWVNICSGDNGYQGKVNRRKLILLGYLFSK